MPCFKTAVVLPSEDGKLAQGPLVATHEASSYRRAIEIAREEACSDWRHPFCKIDELVVLMCVRLDKPTRSQILDEMQGAAA
jgi:hypothetical protein